MKLFKKALLAISFVATIFSLASCNKKEEEPVDYSNLTFADVFEVKEYSHGGKTVMPGLTINNLISPTAAGGYHQPEKTEVPANTFFLTTKYKITITGISYNIVCENKEMDYSLTLIKHANEATYYLEEKKDYNTPTTSDFISYQLAKPLTLNKNKSLYFAMDGCIKSFSSGVLPTVIYNFKLTYTFE